MVLSPPRSANEEDQAAARAAQSVAAGNGGGLDPADIAAALASINGGGTSQADQLAAMRYYNGQAYNNSQLEDSFSTVGEGRAQWYRFDPQERISLARTMARFGLITNEDDYFNAQKVWDAAVEEAARYYTYGNRKISPYDAIGLFAGLDSGWRTKDGKNGLLSGGVSKARTETSTSSGVKMLAPTEAKALITDVFKSELGRAPSPGELSRYTSSLAGAAKKNPVRTTQTVKYDATGRPVDTQTTQSGGVDFQQVSQDKAQADPEYGAYQAATTYMNALLSAIGSP